MQDLFSPLVKGPFGGAQVILQLTLLWVSLRLGRPHQTENPNEGSKGRMQIVRFCVNGKRTMMHPFPRLTSPKRAKGRTMMSRSMIIYLETNLDIKKKENILVHDEFTVLSYPPCPLVHCPVTGPESAQLVRASCPRTSR